MSLAVTLQDSRVRDFKFFNVFKCRKPELVIREFETFKETSPVNPEINSNVLSVRLQFWDRLSSDKDVRSFMFFTPASVNPPPHISSDCRFLKFTQKYKQLKNRCSNSRTRRGGGSRIK
uniref:Uncharacterized protein n=1 Tax=Rhizophora mucronata TaxID=61149 RepID=A0A2P2MLH9_RHIMU